MAEEQTTDTPQADVVEPTGPAEVSHEGIRLTTTTNSQAEAEAALGVTPDPEPATSAEPDAPAVPPDEAATDKATEEPPKETRAERRIATLTARNYEKDAQIAELQRKLAAVTPPPASETPPETPPAGSTQPDPNDFQDTQAYIEAVAEWKAEEKVRAALAERDTQAQERQKEVNERTVIERWTERIDETRAIHADYDEVVGACVEPTTPAFVTELTQMERGAEVLYVLAQKPGETTRIAQLSPRQIIRELTKLEATLDAAPAMPETSEVPPASNGPTTPAAPLTPVIPSGTEMPKSPDDMSYREYQVWREKNMRH